MDVQMWKKSLEVKEVREVREGSVKVSLCENTKK